MGGRSGSYAMVTEFVSTSEPVPWTYSSMMMNFSAGEKSLVRCRPATPEECSRSMLAWSARHHEGPSATNAGMMRQFDTKIISWTWVSQMDSRACRWRCASAAEVTCMNQQDTG